MFIGKGLYIQAVVVGVALTLAAVVPALAAHAWQSRAPMPAPREGACGGVIGNAIYVAYGFGFGDQQTLFRYDIDTDSWSDLTATSTPLAPPRSEGAEAVHGGRLYCIAGRSFVTGTLLNDLDRFAPATGTWASLASMPASLAGITAAVKGNSIYVFGGRTGAGGPCSGPAVNTIYRYDIDQDTWAAAGTLNTARSDASAVEKGGKIYIFGGCNGGFGGGPFFTSVEVYDPGTGVTTVLGATLPVGVASAGAADAGNEIHITGGLGAGNAHQVFKVPSQAFGPAGTLLPAAGCGPGVSRGEHDLLNHGGRLWAVGGSCPAYGGAIPDMDSLKLAP